MSFTLCSSLAIIAKAGANASTAATASSAIVTQLADEAEALIYATTRYDWVANYSLVSTNAKQILSEVASAHAAMQLIMYDMSGYTSRSEAQTMLDVLDDKVKRGLTTLSLQETQDEIVT